jgi:hypothetical protein
LIFAILMARDEADVIGDVCRHLLDQGCNVLIADNLSVDGTKAILDGIAAADPRLRVLVDAEPAYHQAEKMTELARRAASLGATWIVPVDADELWYSTDGRTLAEVLDATSADVLAVPSYRAIGGWDRLHERERLPKVCFRWREGAALLMGNHDVDHPGARTADHSLVIRHWPFRGFEQSRRKVIQGTRALVLAGHSPQIGFIWRKLAAADEDEARHWWAYHSGLPTTHSPVPGHRAVGG